MDKIIIQFIFLALLVGVAHGQQEHAIVKTDLEEAQHRCGHDHPALKSMLENAVAQAPSENKSAVCKKVRVYWIVANGESDNSVRRKYCEIGVREVQQQWASQGRTAYFENMKNLYTDYTIQDFVAADPENWFSFAINNVIIPLVGPNNYDSRTLFFVDGDYSTCCAFGAGGDQGWAGMSNWTISGISNYISENNYDSRADIGAIAHELGHAFNMPHEDGLNGSVNCDDQCAPKGIMCNGGSPSPCGEYKGYPNVNINGWNNNYFGQFPEYFTELGGSCNGPIYIGASGGDSQLLTGVQYVIRSKGSNKVLTASDGNIIQQEYTGSADQTWTIGPESYGLNIPEKIRYQQIINVGTGQAIDNYAYNMDPGGNIVAWANNQQNNQFWRLINRGGGYYAIQNLISGRVMDVQGASMAENANIQQWTWNGTDAQLWSFQDPNFCNNLGGDTDLDGICDANDQCPGLNDNLIGTSCDDGDPCTTGEIYGANCACEGGTLLDADGDGVCDANDQCPGLNDNLIGTSCDDGNPCTAGETYGNDCSCGGGIIVEEDGGGQICTGSEYVYTITNVNSGKLLDVSGGSTANGANVQQWDNNGSVAQEWYFQDVGNSQYTLTNINSVKVLEVAGFNTENGGNVQQWEYANVNSQKWIVDGTCIDGYYKFYNVNSGKVLDVSGGSTASGANVQQWNDNDTNATKWTLTLVTGECNNDVCANLGGDTDGDGVCNADDQCPNLNDNLIGTACNDNNPSTTNDIWQSDCTCKGTPICTIGATCDDGNLCTTGETFDANCNCTGGIIGDIDNDGVCDAEDICDGLNDNLIGTACDDGDPNTINETWLSDCSCGGGIINTGCLPFLDQMNNQLIDQSISVEQYIQTNGLLQSGEVEYRAEEYILMREEFEVKQGAVYHALIAPCNQ